jgi:hypothetical protein
MFWNHFLNCQPMILVGSREIDPAKS